jgi:hypothetical protein
MTMMAGMANTAKPTGLIQAGMESARNTAVRRARSSADSLRGGGGGGAGWVRRRRDGAFVHGLGPGAARQGPCGIRCLPLPPSAHSRRPRQPPPSKHPPALSLELEQRLALRSRGVVELVLERQRDGQQVGRVLGGAARGAGLADAGDQVA